jgi:threonine/homoserine/homoserine lactone efflux protein
MFESSLSLLKQGLVIGLAGAVSVGPMSIFCIQRTLTRGVVSGIMASSGAATAMALLGSIGALSLNLISAVLVQYKAVFCIIAGLFLCYLGIKIFGNRLCISSGYANLSKRSSDRGQLFSDYGTALLLNMVNPVSVLPLLASFVQTYSTQASQNHLLIGMFAIGIFMSTLGWYGLLSCGVNLLPQKMLLFHLKWINRVAGATIVAIGCVSIYAVWAG